MSLNPKTFGFSGKIATFDVAWYRRVAFRVAITESAKTMAKVARTTHFRFLRIRQ